MPAVENCPQKPGPGGAKTRPDCPKTDFRQTPVVIFKCFYAFCQKKSVYTSQTSLVASNLAMSLPQHSITLS